jgi:hypothetical protein
MRRGTITKERRPDSSRNSTLPKAGTAATSAEGRKDDRLLMRLADSTEIPATFDAGRHCVTARACTSVIGIAVKATTPVVH